MNLIRWTVVLMLVTYMFFIARQKLTIANSMLHSVPLYILQQ